MTTLTIATPTSITHPDASARRILPRCAAANVRGNELEMFSKHDSERSFDGYFVDRPVTFRGAEKSEIQLYPYVASAYPYTCNQSLNFKPCALPMPLPL